MVNILFWYSGIILFKKKIDLVLLFLFLIFI